MSSDPIRDLARELLDYAVMCGGIIKSEGLWDEVDDCSDGLLDRARAALAATPTEPTEAEHG